MRAKVLLLFAVCLVASGAFGAGTYELFAKESLGVDLAKIPFGTAAETNGRFGKTDAPLSAVGLPGDDGLSWMTNEVSGKYKHDFGNRFLKYGFRDGKLVAVRVSISAFGGPGFTGGDVSQEMTARRKELVQIHEAFLKVRKAEKAASNPGRHDIQYGAMCSPSPESLYLMEFQITLREEKEAAGSGLDIHP